MEELSKVMDKLITRFIRESKKFITITAFPYGLMDRMKYNKTSAKLIYDFEYFTFTKSTKSLMSIKNLLKQRNNEDALILARSIFENYLSCRYLQENENKIDSFISNPLGLALSHYNLNTETKEIITREKEVIGTLEDPSSFKLSSDKKYYYDFYSFLCMFTHCNFGIIDCYLNKHNLFTFEKVNHSKLTHLIVIFVFTKIFEAVVTVEGEEFLDERHEQNCYTLVNDAIKLQKQVFDALIPTYQNSKDEFYKYQNKKMRGMLKDMKKSLTEEIGSVDKSTL